MADLALPLAVTKHQQARHNVCRFSETGNSDDSPDKDLNSDESLDSSIVDSEELDELEDESYRFNAGESDMKISLKRFKKKARNNRRKSSRELKTEKKNSVLRRDAEMLRQRRMEELRVRNEELQNKQNKEDQKRADEIASRFDMDTDELRHKRRRGRLDLLKKLEFKRLQVIIGSSNRLSNGSNKKNSKNESNAPSIVSTSDSNPESDSDAELEIIAKNNGEETSNKLHIGSEAANSTSDSDSESDSDMELEIVDKKNGEETRNKLHIRSEAAGFKNLSSQSKASQILNEAQSSLTQPKNALTKKKASLGASSEKSLTTRAALRETLLLKQRKMGNIWLARELGYKTEQDHLRDCLQVEQEKRISVIKKEEKRLKQSVCLQVRERILLEQEGEDGDEVLEELEVEDAEVKSVDKKEDEELVLARQILEERKARISSVESGNRYRGRNKLSSSTNKINNGKAEGADQTNEDQTQQEIKDLSTLDYPDHSDDENNVIFSAPDITMGNDATVDASLNDESKIIEKAIGNKTNEIPQFHIHHQEGEVDILTRPSEGEENSSVYKENSNLSLESIERETERNVGTDNTKFVDQQKIEEGNKPKNPDWKKKLEKEAFRTGNTEFVDQQKVEEKGIKPKNLGWKKMLEIEANKVKKLKRRKGSSFVECEAEEEEEEITAGLEDFGFSLGRKENKIENEEEYADKLEDEDLNHVVDELSDNEGDEEEGDRARKEMVQREEKERHKEIMRRMREGYDGRRGGIAGGGGTARGVHRFEQLVAADNRQDAKRLGLLNDDELESDNEKDDNTNFEKKDSDGIEDETALLDKMIKDRFLHRSSTEVEENFSEDDEAKDSKNVQVLKNDEEAEELEQERLIAKRITKRVRMKRLIKMHGEDKEFSQGRLIDEDNGMKEELTEMRDVGKLKRESSLNSNAIISSQSSGGFSHYGPVGKSNSQNSAPKSISLALRPLRHRARRRRGNKENSSMVQKNPSGGHVVFYEKQSIVQAAVEATEVAAKTSHRRSKHKRKMTTSTSLWEKVAENGFRKRSRKV